MTKWFQDWLLLFNVDKCKVMHIGNNNIKAKYEMNGKLLEEVTVERDLGVNMFQQHFDVRDAALDWFV